MNYHAHTSGYAKPVFLLSSAPVAVAAANTAEVSLSAYVMVTTGGKIAPPLPVCTFTLQRDRERREKR